MVGVVAYIKQAAVVLLGLLLLGLVVLGWGLATGSITSYAERFWCWAPAIPRIVIFAGLQLF
jgi:hypothetical protein